MNLYKVAPKSDNKAGWVLARMFLNVGARFHHSHGLGGKKYYMHYSFAKIIYHTELFVCRCLIDETEFWCYVSKECATATLCESSASRLQLSNEPSNGSRSLAIPVTVREAAESEQSTPCTRNRQLIKNVSNEIRQCLCEKLLMKPVSRANRSAA